MRGEGALKAELGFELIGASHKWGKSMRAGVGPSPEKNENLCL